MNDARVAMRRGEVKVQVTQTMTICFIYFSNNSGDVKAEQVNDIAIIGAMFVVNKYKGVAR